MLTIVSSGVNIAPSKHNKKGNEMKPKHTVHICIAPSKKHEDVSVKDRQKTSDISLDKFISSIKAKTAKRREEVMATRELAAIEGMFI